MDNNFLRSLSAREMDHRDGVNLLSTGYESHDDAVIAREKTDAVNVDVVSELHVERRDRGPCGPPGLRAVARWRRAQDRAQCRGQGVHQIGWMINQSH